MVVIGAASPNPKLNTLSHFAGRLETDSLGLFVHDLGQLDYCPTTLVTVAEFCCCTTWKRHSYEIRPLFLVCAMRSGRGLTELVGNELGSRRLETTLSRQRP
jgi:hypothetical protein